MHRELTPRFLANEFWSIVVARVTLPYLCTLQLEPTYIPASMKRSDPLSVPHLQRARFMEFFIPLNAPHHCILQLWFADRREDLRLAPSIPLDLFEQASQLECSSPTFPSPELDSRTPCQAHNSETCEPTWRRSRVHLFLIMHLCSINDLHLYRDSNNLLRLGYISIPAEFSLRSDLYQARPSAIVSVGLENLTMFLSVSVHVLRHRSTTSQLQASHRESDVTFTFKRKGTKLPCFPSSHSSRASLKFVCDEHPRSRPIWRSRCGYKMLWLRSPPSGLHFIHKRSHPNYRFFVRRVA
jgi:hypothetical protein